MNGRNLSYGRVLGSLVPFMGNSRSLPRTMSDRAAPSVLRALRGMDRYNFPTAKLSQYPSRGEIAAVPKFHCITGAAWANGRSVECRSEICCCRWNYSHMSYRESNIGARGERITSELQRFPSMTLYRAVKRLLPLCRSVFSWLNEFPPVFNMWRLYLLTLTVPSFLYLRDVKR